MREWRRSPARGPHKSANHRTLPRCILDRSLTLVLPVARDALNPRAGEAHGQLGAGASAG
jgi:hypothetical protein